MKEGTDCCHIADEVEEKTRTRVNQERAYSFKRKQVLCWSQFIMGNAIMTEGRSTSFLCCPGCFIDVPHGEGWGSRRRQEEGGEKV